MDAISKLRMIKQKTLQEFNIDMDLIKTQTDLDRLNNQGVMPDGRKVIPDGNSSNIIFVKLFKEDVDKCLLELNNE